MFQVLGKPLAQLHRLAVASERLADLLLAVYDRLRRTPPQPIPHGPSTEGPPIMPDATLAATSAAATPVSTPLDYRCSRCDARFQSYPLLDPPAGMIRALVDVENGRRDMPKNGLPFAATHVCDDGGDGIGYVVGVRVTTAAG